MTTSPNTTSTDLGAALRHLLLALAASLVGYAVYDGGYLITVVGFSLIYTVFVTGLNVFMGYAGQTSFGQNAFAAIGAYASAVLTATYGWPPLAAVAAGLAGSVVCAALVGFPTLRLKGHYLAMATLAIGLIVYEAIVQWRSLTNGYMGISGIPPIGIGSYEIASERGQLLFLAIVAALGVFASWLLRNSRFGRALVALSGSEEAARALGINVRRYKLAAFVISAVYASLAGSLFVHFVGFVSPEIVGMHMVILAFTMLYIGGIGTTIGPLVGAIVISLLPETFRTLKDYQDLIYGVALIVILIYAPGGIASLGAALRLPRPAGKPAPANKAGATAS
ncbi:branched-chain amino acid ABC transporter permease [Bosea sp. F3-2]|uniref:branched-chain amino acid ABC transporter permease n=1 Tax=Bosea sp. F3-2 TaxID=2599640 RepID=UPI0011EC0805|nr:branched-chain amino acid ABC transporter permease [Bosea sp. F3-2]QEL22065.1 branched-chain amino acid ABC transporter permease [Bosea sp. F3-2]